MRPLGRIASAVVLTLLTACAAMAQGTTTEATPQGTSSSPAAPSAQERNAYVLKVQKDFSTLDMHIEKLRAKLAKTDKKVLDRLLPESEALEMKKAVVIDGISAASRAGQADWENAKAQLDSAYAALKQAVEQFANHLK